MKPVWIVVLMVAVLLVATVHVDAQKGRAFGAEKFIRRLRRSAGANDGDGGGRFRRLMMNLFYSQIFKKIH